jgi:DNA-binding MarR family transcriptional regulator
MHHSALPSRNINSLTPKQRAVMNAIHAGDGSGGFVDNDQLLRRIPYKTTKPSLHCSLRKLIDKGLVQRCGTEFRRGRVRGLITLTFAGVRMVAGPIDLTGFIPD